MRPPTIPAKRIQPDRGAEARTAATSMLVAAVRASAPRSGWMRFAGIVGGLMVVDSIAELSLAKHVSKRFARRAGEE